MKVMVHVYELEPKSTKHSIGHTQMIINKTKLKTKSTECTLNCGLPAPSLSLTLQMRDPEFTFRTYK